MSKLLLKMLDIRGPSGKEKDIRNFILKEVRKCCKDVKVDKFGNIIVHKKGKGKVLMLAAHMDEISLMIKSIANGGIMSISIIGGMEAAALIGQRCIIRTKKADIPCIVTVPEISDDETLDEFPEIEDLIVDSGLTRDELKKKGVEVGNFIEFDQTANYLAKKDLIMGKALDDRIGCYIMIKLIESLKKHKGSDIYFVFTVQEEVGLYGAKTSAFEIKPDWALAVDVTNADDIQEHAHEVTKALGKGPCITVKDSDMIANHCLDEWIKDIAKKKKIPYQLEVSDIGTTDALSISISRGGVPTTAVCVPVRNLHTSYGIASLKDVDNCIKLLTALLKNPPKVCYD